MSEEGYRVHSFRSRRHTRGISPPSESYGDAATKEAVPLITKSEILPIPHGTTIHRSSTAGSGGLAQEIHDEFLVCKICLDKYKNPKCLQCLHTFCEQCIENHVMSECTYKKYSDYREFTCPLCRKRTALPVGGVKKLPDNFLVASLTEVVDRQKPSKFPFCDFCKLGNQRHKEAALKCLDCAKLLCRICSDIHKNTKVTSNHSLVDLETEKDIICKEHEDEVVRFYCEQCDACVCVLCTFAEHQGHDILHFHEAVLKYREVLEGLVVVGKSKIKDLDKHMAVVGRCESVISSISGNIHKTAEEFIRQIQEKEAALIGDLQTIYGSDVMNQIKEEQTAKENIENLRNTCNLTEMILNGKDIELLLVKKQIQEKLTSLSDIMEVINIPDSAVQNFTFFPGGVELGYLENTDDVKKTSRSAFSHFNTNNSIKTCSRSVQTDFEHLRNASDHENQGESTTKQSHQHNYVIRTVEPISLVHATHKAPKIRHLPNRSYSEVMESYGKEEIMIPDNNKTDDIPISRSSRSSRKQRREKSNRNEENGSRHRSRRDTVACDVFHHPSNEHVSSAQQIDTGNTTPSWRTAVYGTENSVSLDHGQGSTEANSFSN